MYKYIVLFVSAIFCLHNIAFCEINFSGTQSTILLEIGSQLILGNNVLGWNGTLVKKTDATITGSSICFDSGIFSDGQQDIKFSGTYRGDGSVALADSAQMNLTKKMDLSQTLTFNGSCTLDGNGNVLNLAAYGKIFVQRGASLIFKNIIINGVGTDNIFCMDNSSTISFQNVTWHQSSDYTFSIGHFDVVGDWYVKGGHKFTYKGTKQSTIFSGATLFLDSNVTFSYDPGSMRTDLIYFQDNLATLQMSGATLHATLTGMQLKHGQLIVSKASFLSSEKTSVVDAGITFGNNIGSDDFTCQILNGTKFELTAGTIRYKNVNAASWFMENPYSIMQVDGNCNFYLYQNLDLGTGQLYFVGYSGLYFATGKRISGYFNSTGALNYVEF